MAENAESFSNLTKSFYLLAYIINYMPKIIEAIYENGVFKPLQKVDLKEGEKVRLKIEEISVIDRVFGILRGKDTLKALGELEDEWVFVDSSVFLKILEGDIKAK